jgi:hypothetical protein
MSGQAGGRGYLVQTLICLLDAVQNTHEWTEVSIEPEHVSEKIDILWKRDTYSKIVQVKSSINQIGITDTQRWCESLERSASASEYELRLIGPCSESVSSVGSVGKVRVPSPLPLNPVAFIEQAAHKLDG